jgi:hypothetical protein
MSSEPNFQHSDPRMKLPVCQAKIMNSFGDFFPKSLKRWFFLKKKKFKFQKIFWIENLRKLVFRHIKLKLLTKASISCLSHPSMSITTWFMKCFRNCVFAKNYAISEKLQHVQLWKFAVFHTSCGTSGLASMNKIRVGMVFSLVRLTWNDPKVDCSVCLVLWQF